MARPSSYKPEFAEQARKLCQLGATDNELGDFFGVRRETIWAWAQKHEEFSNSLKAGKDAADERVAQSLYHRAVGYTFDSEKVFQHQGEVVRAPIKEHVPPDTTAMIFWLKNRRPHEWRDKREIEHSGAIDFNNASDEELARIAGVGRPGVAASKGSETKPH